MQIKIRLSIADAEQANKIIRKLNPETVVDFQDMGPNINCTFTYTLVLKATTTRIDVFADLLEEFPDLELDADVGCVDAMICLSEELEAQMRVTKERLLLVKEKVLSQMEE